MGKWFLKLSQYSTLEECKMSVGVLLCFEFIFDIFKTGIKNNLSCAQVAICRSCVVEDRPSMKTEFLL